MGLGEIPTGDEPIDEHDRLLIERFAASARTSMPRAPLYSALSAGIAQRRGLYRLLLQAPEAQRLPVLLFACVHALLLDRQTDELAQWYPNLTVDARSPDDPALMTAFERFVAAHARELATLLRTRTTQTNEVGRCALLLPAFGILSTEVGPLAYIDVGASGGLNLLLDRFRYIYVDPDGVETAVGDRSPVTLTIGTTGAIPVPAELPAIAARCGIDRHAIDVTDHRQARWLQACIWPDQRERFHRLGAAIEIAKEVRPLLIQGDAAASLRMAIERFGESGHPVVTNSWVLNYFSRKERVAYLAELDRIGADRDLSWVYAEAPALISGIPTDPDPADPHLTVLSMIRWRNGRRTVEHLATCHPHGYWIHWR